MNIFLVFINDVHGHKYVESVVNPPSNVLLIIMLNLLRVLTLLVSVFGDQLVGHLVVRRRYLVLHLLAHQHGEVTEALAALLALRRRPSTFAFCGLALFHKHGRSFIAHWA